MTGYPLEVMVLAGLGFRNLFMSPSAIRQVKKHPPQAEM
jgi:signal transduction protein with GAF and PtsI domain